MAWRKVPTNPRERKAAVRWFRERVALTAAEWEQLTDYAKLRAFALAGTTELSVVQTALDEMARAVQKDEDLDDFKARLRKKLEDDFVDKNSARLKRSFVTTTQTALSAGRWYALEQVPNKPYRIYDVTLDGVTTHLCRNLRKVVVRADNPMLLIRWPPLHWNCRTQIRGISRRTALRYGITEHLDRSLQPMAGFGYAPILAEDDPDLSGFDPAAVDVFKRRSVRRRKKT